MHDVFFRQVNEATTRAARVAHGKSGTLRIGFTESASWHGVVPDFLSAIPPATADAELQLNPSTSLEQIEAVRSGRLDAGFVYNVFDGVEGGSGIG